MIEVNLLPEELRKKEAPKFVLPEMPNVRTLFIALVVFFGAQVLLIIFAVFQGIEFSSVKKSVAALTEQNKTIILQKSEIAAMRSELKRIKSLTEKKLFWSSLLNALSDSMTKGVWLRKLSVTEELRKATPPAGKGSRSSKMVRTLSLEGSIISPGQETAYIGKFIKELKSHPVFNELFDQIELSNIHQKKIKEFDVYDFVLACVFKKERF